MNVKSKYEYNSKRTKVKIKVYKKDQKSKHYITLYQILDSIGSFSVYAVALNLKFDFCQLKTLKAPITAKDKPQTKSSHL